MYKFSVFLEVLAQIKSRHIKSLLSFSFIFFRCNKGYTLEGEKESSCLASGSWSHSPPVCELVKCSSPEDISHGKYLLSGLTYLSTVTYSCETGYRYRPRHQPSFLLNTPLLLITYAVGFIGVWLTGFKYKFLTTRPSQMCRLLDVQPIANARGNSPSDFDSGSSH